MTPQERLAVALAHNPRCFGCGPENPAGVGFRDAVYADGRLHGVVSFGDQHEGGIGRTHGGVLAAALDEVLGLLCHIEFAGDCLTARLEIDYRRAAVTGTTCAIEGWTLERDGRKLWVAGAVRDADGVLAAAKGLWLTPRASPEEGNPSLHRD